LCTHGVQRSELNEQVRMYCTRKGCAQLLQLLRALSLYQSLHAIFICNRQMEPLLVKEVISLLLREVLVVYRQSLGNFRKSDNNNNEKKQGC